MNYNKRKLKRMQVRNRTILVDSLYKGLTKGDSVFTSELLLFFLHSVTNQIKKNHASPNHFIFSHILNMCKYWPDSE